MYYIDWWLLNTESNQISIGKSQTGTWSQNIDENTREWLILNTLDSFEVAIDIKILLNIYIKKTTTWEPETISVTLHGLVKLGATWTSSWQWLFSKDGQ